MSQARRARRRLPLGALLCIPGAAGVIVFATTWADADAVRVAPTCSRDSNASCLSVIPGTITERYPGGTKALPQVTIHTADAAVRVGYDCVLSGGACAQLSTEPGTAVATGWWKGALVTFGPPGARPAIVTTDSPESHLSIEAFLLALVIPAVWLLLAGLLALRAPVGVTELIEESLARWPDPPRTVEPALIRRVAWAAYPAAAAIAWAVLYLIPSMLVVLFLGQPRLAPLFLLATFLTAWGGTAVIGPAYLSDQVRNSVRRSIGVRRVEEVSSRGFTETQISYDRPDGQAATWMLGAHWNGYVEAGDRIDALTDPKSGSIVRVLSTPPASPRVERKRPSWAEDAGYPK